MVVHRLLKAVELPAKPGLPTQLTWPDHPSMTEQVLSEYTFAKQTHLSENRPAGSNYPQTGSTVELPVYLHDPLIILCSWKNTYQVYFLRQQCDNSNRHLQGQHNCKLDSWSTIKHIFIPLNK